MNHLRLDFERAMQKYSQVNEGSQREYMGLAQSSKKEDKDKLYNMINIDFFDGEAPYKERLNIKSFNDSDLASVEKLLKTNSKAANILVDLGGDVTGIGRGEIMMAYIVENCGIGGGSQDIDLTLYNDKGGVLDQAELKEVKLSKDGFLYGWRTGAKHRGVITNTITDLKNLYLGLKDVLPELNTKTSQGSLIQNNVAKGEGAKFINLIKDLDPVIVKSPLTFDVQESPEGNLIISKVGGDAIGDLNSKSTLDSLKTMLSSQNKIELKSFSTIESELAAGFGSVKEKFVFIHTIGNKKKFGWIYYKSNISSSVKDTKFDAWSGGTVKVRVKA